VVNETSTSANYYLGISAALLVLVITIVVLQFDAGLRALATEVLLRLSQQAH
jgi:hypothetical protein